MHQLRVTLETVTPLFLGGADPRGAPKLRPPSFRGAMRYWFRALAGGVLGDSNQALEKIREAEAQIFGSPDDKHGQSAVWVRLSTPDYDRTYKTRVLPHRGDTWSNHQSKNLRNDPKPAIPPGVTPTLTLTLKPNADIQKLELAAWSMLVSLTLGGIGKRSRRGFGSLRIQAIEELPAKLNDTLKHHLEQATQLPAGDKELASRVGGLLTAARSTFAAFLGNPTPRFNTPPRFSVLKSNTHIVVWRPDGSMGNHVAVLSPLMNNLSDLMRDVGEKKFAEAFGGIRPRRSSPLWVSTHRLSDGDLALVLAHLKARYTDRWQGREHQLVTDFLNSPPHGWTKTEVTL